MKPEGRSSFRYSFRRSFRRKKVEEENEKSPEEVKAEQERAFSELKSSVSDFVDKQLDDDFLERFLKARDYDVKEAEKLFRTHASCRKLLMLDVMKDSDVFQFQLAKDHCFTGIIGYDKEGCLVRVINYGSADLMGFISALSTVDILKILLYFIHRDIDMMREENKRTGRNAKQLVYIGNMEHMSSSSVLQKPIIDTELFGLKLFQDHFYDIAKHVYIINAPAIFNTVYKMIKPVIGEKLRKAIKIFTNDKWKEVLLEHIDADVLPVYFGGNRVGKNGDPRCIDTICYGGVEVPRGLTESKKEYIKNDTKLMKVTVDAGAFLNIPLSVKEKNTMIKYVVLTKEHDLNMAIFYKPPDLACKTPPTKKKTDQKEVLSSMEQMSPFIRCQCHIRPLSGQLLAFKPGTYVLHVDNTYSWVNPKEVYYRFELETQSSRSSNDLLTRTSRIKLV